MYILLLFGWRLYKIKLQHKKNNYLARSKLVHFLLHWQSWRTSVWFVQMFATPSFETAFHQTGPMYKRQIQNRWVQRRLKKNYKQNFTKQQMVQLILQTSMLKTVVEFVMFIIIFMIYATIMTMSECCIWEYSALSYFYFLFPWENLEFPKLPTSLECRYILTNSTETHPQQAWRRCLVPEQVVW